jgi:hypothetical protein
MASSASSARPLHIADDGVEQHHGEHHGGVDHMADQHGEHRCGEQHIDQDIVELGEEAQDLAALDRRGETVGTEVLLARFGLVSSKAMPPRVERD